MDDMKSSYSDLILSYENVKISFNLTKPSSGSLRHIHSDGMYSIRATMVTSVLVRTWSHAILTTFQLRQLFRKCRCRHLNLCQQKRTKLFWYFLYNLKKSKTWIDQFLKNKSISIQRNINLNQISEIRRHHVARRIILAKNMLLLIDRMKNRSRQHHRFVNNFTNDR